MLNKIKSLVLLTSVLAVSFSSMGGLNTPTFSDINSKKKNEINIDEKNKKLVERALQNDKRIQEYLKKNPTSTNSALNQLLEQGKVARKRVEKEEKEKELLNQREDNEPKPVNAAQDAVKPAAKTPSRVEATSVAVFAAIDQTLNVAAQGLSQQSSAIAAAGECESANGVWGSVFFANTKDKRAKQVNTNSKGALIGYQNMFSEGSIVGLAATIIDSGQKARGETSTDHSKIYMGSLNIATNIDSAVVKGAAFIGSGNGKIKADHAKTKDVLYGLQAGLGYEVAMDEHLITPAIDIKWLTMNMKQTAKDAATDKNVTTKSNGSVVSGSAELKYAYKIASGDISFSPTIRIGVSNIFSNTLKKAGKRVDILQGSKTKFYTGLDLTAKGENVDFQIGGKFDMGKKSIGYTAAVSVLAKL